MPELPEVETVRLQLLQKVVGKTIAMVQVFHKKTVAHNKKVNTVLRGRSITGIDRVGKLLIFSLSSGPVRFLLAHLKMTGQFFFVDQEGVTGGGHSMTKADVAKFPGKHTRVAFHFTDKSTLYFNDMRLFGYVKVATEAEVERARAGFGQEPIAEDFNTDAFVQGVRRRRAPIKAILLDQSFIAGLGNIYVDEALWRAKVRPTRIGTNVTTTEAKLIAKVAREVLNKSIEVKGTTFQHFGDTEGKAGNYSKYLKVFGKQNTPCPRCKTTIKKIRVAGRGTHYCPTCQT